MSAQPNQAPKSKRGVHLNAFKFVASLLDKPSKKQVSPSGMSSRSTPRHRNEETMMSAQPNQMPKTKRGVHFNAFKFMASFVGKDPGMQRSPSAMSHRSTPQHCNEEIEMSAVPNLMPETKRRVHLNAVKFMARIAGKRSRMQRLAMKFNARCKTSGSRSTYALDAVPIHSGKFSAVYRGVEKSSNNVVAVKVFQQSELECINIDGEIAMLRRFSNHPNIIDFFCCYKTSSEFHLVVEYMYGGALINVVPRHGLEFEQDAAGYLLDIAAALCYMHRNCVAHRNLTPENLMLTYALGGHLKVCDFRWAKSLPAEDAPMRDPCGTWAYAAPEVLWLQRTSKGSYTLKCDMFSVGVILYFLLVGYHPFDPFKDHKQTEVCNNICQGLWRFETKSWYGISPEAKAVVTGLLDMDPVKRFNATQIACHPWVVPFEHAVDAKPRLSSLEMRGELPHDVDRCKNLVKIEKHSGSTRGLDVVSEHIKTIMGKASEDELAGTNEQSGQRFPCRNKPSGKATKKFETSIENKLPGKTTKRFKTSLETKPLKKATKRFKTSIIARKAPNNIGESQSDRPKRDQKIIDLASLAPEHKIQCNHLATAPSPLPIKRVRGLGALSNPKKNSPAASNRSNARA